VKTLVTASGRHANLSHAVLTDDQRAAVAADMIERLLPTFTAGLHAADDQTLRHEEERCEALPTSPLIERMRAAIAAEWQTRHTVRLMSILGRFNRYQPVCSCGWAPKSYRLPLCRACERAEKHAARTGGRVDA
jgi:hypothetical protein